MLRTTHCLIALFRPLLLSVAVVFVPFAATAAADARPQTVEAENGVVVSVSPEASEVGLTILKQGGTAVDAAVATALALAVTYPPAGNIGGGGFMMIHPGGGEDPVCVDYRETAPAAATRDMFALDDSRYGHKIVGVPGTLRGLELAHQQFGKLPWRQLVQPAVGLAEDGFPVGARLAKSLNGLLESEASQPYQELLRVFAPPHGRRWNAEDRLVQDDLAKTLDRIARHGADDFYHGQTAQLIVEEMRSDNGLITAKDLTGYRAKLRSPIHTTFRGYDVYGPPPPSSGGICLAQMLNILENFDLRGAGRWSPQTLHWMIEAMRRAYLDRARHLGDSDFVKIPPHLTRKKYAARLAADIDPHQATSSLELADDIQISGEGTSTTHFSIVDSSGLAVSNTYTLERSYGARVVVRGGGFLLNNEMGDFNWKPGHTDRRGHIGTPANRIEPGKRMLSSMTPTIVARKGNPVLLTGSPGGRTIINTVLCVVLNVLEFEMELPQAVVAPRLHHQWLPDAARFEAAGRERFEAVLDDLRGRGHRIERAASQGDAHSIGIDAQGQCYRGVADSRRDGRAVGY